MRSARKTGRASLLLEVVVALTVLVTAMGLLGAQLSGGLNMTAYARDQLAASQVADRILALIEFDPETQERLFSGEQDEFEDEFGQSEDEDALWRVKDQFPGYFWRVTVQPLEPDDPDPQIKQVVVEILHQDHPEDYDTIDGARLVRRLAFLRARPTTIDTEELNLDELDPEALEGMGLPPEVTGQLPDLMSLLSMYDTGQGIDLQRLIAMVDQETLQQYMPIIQALLAQNGGGIPAEWQQFLQQGAGGLTEQLSEEGALEQIQEAVGGGAPPRRGPGRAPGARRGGGGRGGNPATPPPSGRGGGGRRGGSRAGGSGQGGAYTIEDLMRMRDEARGGGNRGP